MNANNKSLLLDFLVYLAKDNEKRKKNYEKKTLS